MKDVFINIKLSLKDAKKLKDLVPEVSESIDRYYVFKRIYDKTVFDLCNYMKFLSIHDFREHMSKLRTVNYTIDSFFDNPSKYSDLKKYYSQQHAMEFNKLACSIYDLFNSILRADEKIFNDKYVESFSRDCLLLLNRLDNIIKE
jgi:hypothetical protein